MPRNYAILRVSFFICTDGHISDRARYFPETKLYGCSHAKDLNDYGLIAWCSCKTTDIPLKGEYKAALLLGGADAGAQVMREKGLVYDVGWDAANYIERVLLHPASDHTRRAARLRRRQGREPLGPWSRRRHTTDRTRSG